MRCFSLTHLRLAACILKNKLCFCNKKQIAEFFPRKKASQAILPFLVFLMMLGVQGQVGH